MTAPFGGYKRLYRDAGSIATSSAANVVLGVAFWALAAKLFPPEQLGVMTAVLAVIVAAGLVIGSGIGNAYTALLPAAGSATAPLYRHGQRVFYVLAGISGVVAAFGTTAFLDEARGSVAVGVLVAAGVVVWAAFVLQNSTLAALARAGWLPSANVAASLGKIVLLPVLVFAVGWHSLELATVVGAAVVVLVLAPVIRRTIVAVDPTTRLPAPRSFGVFNRLVVSSVASVGLSLGVLLLSPFLVTAFGGPSQGALFALSLSVVQALDLIGAAMGVSLVVHASGSSVHTWAMARPVLIRAAALVTAVALLIAVAAPIALTLLNPEYGAMGASGVIALMCAGSVVRVLYMVWAAMQLARRNMKALLALNVVTAALFFALIPAMAGSRGALGGAFALLVAQSVLSAGAAAHIIVNRRRAGDPGKVENEMAKHRRLEQAGTPWQDAVWVGQVDEAEVAGDRLLLHGGSGFRRARLLVWSKDHVRGSAELAVDDGAVDVGELLTEIAALPEPADEPEVELPAISVVLCTKDRPLQLRDAVEGLIALDYPKFEILVVDNNPGSGLTRPIVDAFPSGTIRRVDAPAAGLSIARNAGVKNARYDIVAFTDDDVIVDHRWLRGLAVGFARSDRVSCVCGMVPSAEVLTPAQSYFDRRVGWAGDCEPAIYSLADPPKDDPLFPLRVADYGTGANFAVRKDVVIDLGGFDEGLGVGSPAGGGEDIDMFVRIVLAGHELAREPSAVVWHRHRRSVDELNVQIYNYGLGLGAWIFKLLLRPKTLAMVISRSVKGIRHLRAITVVDSAHDDHSGAPLDGLNRRELSGVLHGPWSLLRSRMSGRVATPLRRPATLGEPRHRLRAAGLSITAVVIGLIGALGAAQTLPRPLQALVVGVFVLAGPGSLLLSWYTQLPSYALAALVPVVSLAICLLTVATLLMLGVYSPGWVLTGLATATALGGLLRMRLLARIESAVI
jgi:glycosyltransferase involved in cell wall biosynthesis/O-antigen/teichoic acid export membrane protein